MGRLKAIGHLKKQKNDLKIGIIGCMAERLKEKLIETDQLVDIVVGPDAYRISRHLLLKREKVIKLLMFFSHVKKHMLIFHP